MNSICVFCGSSDNVHPEYLTASRTLGETLARQGLALVYGGGKTGLMGAVARGALGAGGVVIGIIVPDMNTPELAQAGLTRMEIPPNLHARKMRMHELSNGYIALPGGYGTFDELFETITWSQVGVHCKPVGLLNIRGYFDPLIALLEHAVNEGFVFKEHVQALHIADDPNSLLMCLANHQNPDEAVRRWMRQ
ncbi:MAG: TIGR00730 family Rossman fold protein [Anaerolineales bacterium]|nr:TIGR00730 family Rossman fold protein [Anaerolineales bacterium]